MPLPSSFLTFGKYNQTNIYSSWRAAKTNFPSLLTPPITGRYDQTQIYVPWRASKTNRPLALAPVTSGPGGFGGLYEPTPKMREALLIDLTAAAEGTRVQFEFPYMMESFTDSKSAEYANVIVRGRSEPVLGYSHSSNRTFGVNFQLAANKDPFVEVIEPCWLIRSWTYPYYPQSQAALPNVPPRVLFVLGKWLSSRCVVTRVDITYHAPWGRIPYSSQEGTPGGTPDNDNPFGSTDAAGKDSMLPFWAEVQLQMLEVTENTEYTPWDHNDVRKGYDRGSGFF
jgi:hypothetical protein